MSKTKEEILEDNFGKWQYNIAGIKSKEIMIKSMQEYADQAVKQERERARLTIRDMVDAAAIEFINNETCRKAFIQGAKWYRETSKELLNQNNNE